MATDNATIPVAGLYPTSAAQKRMWYMSQLSPDDPHYNVTLAMRLSFDLNQDVLAESLRQLVARHEILRTSYPIVAGVAWQKVSPPEKWNLEWMGSIEVPEEQRLKRCEVLGAEIASLHIDLEHGAVFRAFLWSLGPSDYLLILLTHHIAVDQRTINTLCEELDVLYRACNGERHEQLPVATQYREYVDFERSRFERDRQRLVEYWHQQLIGEFPMLELPYLCAPTDPRRDRRGAEYPIELPPSAVNRFRAWCRRHRLTEFGGILCIWSILLHSVSGGRQLLLGTTTAFREQRRFGRALGCFINTLAIRIDFGAGATINSMAAHVREQLLDAFDHSAFTYERLVEQARKSNPALGEDLINAYLQFQPRSIAVAHQAGGRFAPNLNVFNGRAKFPLMLNISDRGDVFTGHFEYEVDAFKQETIATLASDFYTLIEKIDEEGDKLPEGHFPTAVMRTMAIDTQRTNLNEQAQISEALVEQRPFDDVDHRLADIWYDLLRLRPLSWKDDFMLMGGYSLLLTQLSWRIQQDLGARIPLKELRQNTRMEQMSACVRRSAVASPVVISRPSADSLHVGDISVRLELGVWTRDSLAARIASVNSVRSGSGNRLWLAAESFMGTPVSLKSSGFSAGDTSLSLSLGALDSEALASIAIAMADAKDMTSFVRRFQALRARALADDQRRNTMSILQQAIERNMLVLIAGDLDEKSDLAEGNSSLGLCTGDIAVFRNRANTSHQTYDVGILFVDRTQAYVLQSVIDYEHLPEGKSGVNVFYDTEQRCAQLGVGLRRRRKKNAATFAVGTRTAYALESGVPASLKECLLEDSTVLSAVLRLPEKNDYEP